MKLAIILLAVACAMLGTGTAAAEPYPIKGKILEVYTAKGGYPVFGDAVESEIKQTGPNGNYYRQRTKKGIITWSSYVGGSSAVYPRMIGLVGVSNERDALGPAGHKSGLVFRSGNLCGITSKAKIILSSQVGPHGAEIDLRTSGTCKSPTIPGITRVNYPISSDANYAKYVTDASRRAAFGKALKAIVANAQAGNPTLVHCTAGKDRTGWLVTILLEILITDRAVIKAEYLKSPNVSITRLNAGYAAVETNYGTMTAYIQALGITDDDIGILREYLA